MGRHAAPGDDEPDGAAVTAVLPEAEERPPGSRPSPTPRGRHSVPDDDEDDDVAVVAAAVTERLPVPTVEPASESPSVTETAPDSEPATEAAPVTEPVTETAPSAAKKERATAADWRLLRSDSALRNRVIAAVVAPFVLFVFVLAVIGRLDAVAVWIWLPLICAGIGAGLLLDKAHAKARAEPATPAETSSETSTETSTEQTAD